MSGNGSDTKVGFVGLGLMGRALAEAVMGKGFPVTVWNRSAAKAEPLRAAGASVASSAAEAAESSDVLVVCLYDQAATRAAVMSDEVGAALAGKALVQLSTTTVEDVQELAAWAEARDVAFLKGAILVYPDDIRAYKGEILYGGPEPLYTRLLPVLEGLGGRPSLVGERPSDCVAPTLACYAFLYGSLLSFLHGAAICHRGGVPVETFTRKVAVPFVRNGSLASFLENAGGAAAKRRYEDDLQATLDVWNDALRQTIADIDAMEIEADTLRPFKALLDRTAAAGYGDKDIAAVFETLIAKAEGKAG